jgi:hypothetical protein
MTFSIWELIIDAKQQIEAEKDAERNDEENSLDSDIDWQQEDPTQWE